MTNRYYAVANRVAGKGFPVLVLSNGEKEIFLSPFRLYKFQVSETLEGSWDLGSSQVVGLGNILSARYNPTEKKMAYYSNLSKVETEKYILSLMAKEAIDNAMENANINGEIDTSLFLNYETSGQYKLFREFINATYTYILENM